MPESSPSGVPTGSTGALPRVSGEIVHEQTVRAPIPWPPATETTVRAPIPTAPPPQEQTVRAFVPSAMPGFVDPASDDPSTTHATATATFEDEEFEEVEPEPEVETIDSQVLDVSALVSELEAHVRHAGPELDVPVPRSDQVTVPEAVAQTPRSSKPVRRDEPPAVSGEVSVSDPDHGGLFDLAPRYDERGRPARGAQAPKARREDPPVVSGEVAVDPATNHSPEVPTADVYVMPMTASGSQPIMIASGAQPVMTASGSQPVMTASGSQPAMTASGASPVLPPRSSTDPGYAAGEVTGPQPMGQADATGPHPVMKRRESPRDSLVLWALAGTLVVLAVGVVMLVISWSL